MSSDARLAQLRKVQTTISGMLTDGKCYEAIRLIFTIANRYATSKAYDAAYALSVDGALGLLAQGEASLGAQVGIHYLELLAKAKAEVTEAHVNTIKRVFAAFPADSVAATDAAAGPVTSSAAAATVVREDQAVRFMRAAIKWALGASRDLAYTPFHFDSNTAFAEPRRAPVTPLDKAEQALLPARALAPLYVALAAHLARTQSFALASKAYFKAGAPAQHALCLAAWAQTAPAEERDLFLTRAVLQALAAGDAAHARALSKVYKAKFHDDSALAASPLTHFAEFFPVACERGSQELYKMLVTKYAVVLQRDAAFKELVNKAAGVYCGVQQKKSMLEMMLGGGDNNARG